MFKSFNQRASADVKFRFNNVYTRCAEGYIYIHNVKCLSGGSSFLNLSKFDEEKNATIES